MIITRPFDMQRQFSRNRRLLRKSKVDDAFVEILLKNGGKVKRDTREGKEKDRWSVSP